jgi:SAM-dependent methyltransferase
MKSAAGYLQLGAHYEACLVQHGDSHRGVDWPFAEEVEARHYAMLEVMRPFPPRQTTRLLDFGCGASHLYETIEQDGLGPLIEYVGVDISEQFVSLSRSKFPRNEYVCADILAADGELARLRFDYAVMSGVFTQKLNMSYDEMVDFFQRTVEAVFGLVTHGIAFNLISPHLEWERDHLFHLPLEALTGFVTRRISRRYAIRSDYGIDYEHTLYAYR